MIEDHEGNRDHTVETAVGDSKYGTIHKFLLCHDRKITVHILSLEQAQCGSGRQEGIFPKEAFVYDPATDTFICPAGQTLRRRNYNEAVVLRGENLERLPQGQDRSSAVCFCIFFALACANDKIAPPVPS